MKILPKWHIPFLIILFTTTRATALVMGFRYLSIETVNFLQFLDLDVLRTHLARSLLHLHAQPPLFNLMLGLALKLGGSHYSILILAFQLALGLAAFISVYLGLLELRTSPLLALAAALVLMLNPAELMYEFDALYTEVVFALNCILILAVVKYSVRGSSRYLYAVVGLCVTLTLVRSTFQWSWLALFFVVLWWQTPNARKSIAVAARYGLLLCCLVPAKNYVLFHQFTSSTWVPFSLAKHWDVTDPRSPSWALARKTSLPTLFHIYPDTASYRDWMESDWRQPPTGFPELDDIVKNVGGRQNWNSMAFLQMQRERQREDFFLLRHDPEEFAASVRSAITLYFAPSSVYLTMNFQPSEELNQFHRLQTLDSAINRICCYPFGPPRPHASQGQGRLSRMLDHVRPYCIGSLILYVIALAGLLLSFARNSMDPSTLPRRRVIQLLWVTIAFIFTVVNLLEVGENMRFRQEIQGLVVFVAALTLQAIWEFFAAQKRATAREDNAAALLGSGTGGTAKPGSLAPKFEWIHQAAQQQKLELHWVSAWNMYRAIEKLVKIP